MPRLVSSRCCTATRRTCIVAEDLDSAPLAASPSSSSPRPPAEPARRDEAARSGRTSSRSGGAPRSSAGCACTDAWHRRLRVAGSCTEPGEVGWRPAELRVHAVVPRRLTCPTPRTTITELVTGLGMLGYDDVGDGAWRARPGRDGERGAGRCGTTSNAGAAASRGGSRRYEAAFANGRAFLAVAATPCESGIPEVIDWRGNAKPVDDELVPADLRVDHVYLVSCKYLSKIVVNVSPARLFDGLLRVRMPAERSSWYDGVAPEELERCSARAVTVREFAGRRRTRSREPRPGASSAHALRGAAVAGAVRGGVAARAPPSPRTIARRDGSRRCTTSDDRLRLLWRLLRVGPAPYFVLGVVRRAVRCGCGCSPSWDWRLPLPPRVASTCRRARAGSRSCCGAPTSATGTSARSSEVDGPRRDPVEPWPVQRRARGEGVPRHAARGGARLPSAAVTTTAFTEWSGASCRSSRRRWALCPGPSWWPR